MMNFSRH